MKSRPKTATEGITPVKPADSSHGRHSRPTQAAHCEIHHDTWLTARRQDVTT